MDFLRSDVFGVNEVGKIKNFAVGGIILPLSVAFCCASIQLVLYEAVNHNKVSIH
jgi:hypothetical protein